LANIVIRGIPIAMTDQHKEDHAESGNGAPDDEVKGVDARRKAERIAEAAGRKAREAAIARGETPQETGGPHGLEPTRYGDWEKAGRCTDF
jgi:hypothetical protein